ncbi:MAG TPA: class I SAM-dependent methyltransferase [Bryobacteraceae bacterium]|nr:class I SAM-dependent methyltransferase [Bryobacteraceae bacterium]
MYIRAPGLADLVLALILPAPLALPQQSQTPRKPEVPYVATSEAAIRAMLKLANVTKDDIVYDLGCGDGRIVIAAAKDYGAHGVGIDIDPQRIREANANASKAGVQQLVRFDEKDLFQTDLHNATVVTLFLREDFNVRLRPKLLKELKPGARIVSNTFDMYDWKPDKQLVLPGPSDELFNRKLYLWLVPQK